MSNFTIVVHGGAGRWPLNRRRPGLSGVKGAAANGAKVLRRGGSCLDAVEVAIVSMEDSPVFNAGTGAALNSAGEIEMDAAIMQGRDLEGAGVALVKEVKNPIKLARIVMERTDHVLMAGYGTEQIATYFKLPRATLKVKSRVSAWRNARLGLSRRRTEYLMRNIRLLKTGLFPSGLDTVGALALDRRGDLAAGCSTGGVSLKLPGRIGDSAILGAGLYADNTAGAATATGIGEIAMRLVISKVAVDLMSNRSAEEAAREAIRITGRKIGNGLGLITLDKQGRIGVAHNTPQPVLGRCGGW